MNRNLLLFLFALISCNDNSSKIRKLEDEISELKMKNKATLHTKDSLYFLGDTSSSSRDTNKNEGLKTEGVVEKKKRTDIKYCYVNILTMEPNLDMDNPKTDLYNRKSSIIKIENFNEDEKYKLLDQFEISVNNIFNNDSRIGEKGKILTEHVYCFNTYKEASEHKRNN